MPSIQKRPDGRWRARWKAEDGKETARHFDTKREAQDHLVTVVTDQRMTGRYVDPRATRKDTVGSFYDDWAARQLWATSTGVAMDVAVRSFGRERLLNGLRRSHVEQWVKRMTADGLAPSTVRTRVGNVRSVLRAAVRDRMLLEDPSAGVTLPRLRKAAVAMEIPTPADVGRIRQVVDPHWDAYVAVGAFAGLRLGEASGLQLGDIDWMRRKLHVRRQVQRAPGGAIEVTPPKWGSERTVDVPDELLEILSLHIAGGVRGDEGWLFVGAHGNPPHQNTVGYWWRKACRTVGVESTYHDLRHFFASGLIAAGCDVVTVQRALGHAKPSTTLNTYAHLWPSAEDRTRAAAGGLLRSSIEAAADSSRTGDPASASHPA